MIVLPLMMYGKLRNHWHTKGEYVKKKVKVGQTIVKTGQNKGKKKDVYEWHVDTKKTKVLTGHDGVFARGKNKGQPKPVYETKELPYESTGYFPSENAIYMQIGGGKRLNNMAEAKLSEWHEIAKEWQRQSGWVTESVGNKVIVNMTFYLPDHKIRDTHNCKKLLMDALEGVIHENDMWMIDRTIDFIIDPDNPRIEIEIEDGSHLSKV